jgi:hypothetical protein
MAGALLLVTWVGQAAADPWVAEVAVDPADSAQPPAVAHHVSWAEPLPAGRRVEYVIDRVQLVRPDLGPFAVAGSLEPDLQGVSLRFQMAEGDTVLRARTGQVSGELLTLSGDVHAVGPGGRELFTEELLWRRGSAALVSNGSTLLTSSTDAKPAFHRQLITDMTLLPTPSPGRGFEESER